MRLKAKQFLGTIFLLAAGNGVFAQENAPQNGVRLSLEMKQKLDSMGYITHAAMVSDDPAMIKWFTPAEDTAWTKGADVYGAFVFKTRQNKNTSAVNSSDDAEYAVFVDSNKNAVLEPGEMKAITRSYFSDIPTAAAQPSAAEFPDLDKMVTRYFGNDKNVAQEKVTFIVGGSDGQPFRKMSAGR